MPINGAKDPGGTATAFVGGSGGNCGIKDGECGGKEGGCGGKVGGADVVTAFCPLCEPLAVKTHQEQSETTKTSKLKRIIMTQNDHHCERGVL